MSFPSYSIGNAASSKEVWRLFWNAACYLNGNIEKTVIDFGTGPDSSVTSKNLDPSKVRFMPYPWLGHDHTPSRRISSESLRKRHFDLTTLPVLWETLQSTDLSISGGERYVLTTARKLVTTNAGGTGSASAYPSPLSSDTDINPYADSSGWLAAGFSKLLAVVVCYSIPDPVTPFDGTMYYGLTGFSPGVSEYAAVQVLSGGNTKKGYFDFLMLTRYVQ